jgi:hypothetical protein
LGNSKVAEKKKNNTEKLNGEYIVQFASDDELREHNELISEIDSVSSGKCIWNISKF